MLNRTYGMDNELNKIVELLFDITWGYPADEDDYPIGFDECPPDEPGQEFEDIA